MSHHQLNSRSTSLAPPILNSGSEPAAIIVCALLLAFRTGVPRGYVSTRQFRLATKAVNVTQDSLYTYKLLLMEIKKVKVKFTIIRYERLKFEY